jgi:hopanoid biosynthesis associated protein HpnK
MMNEACQSPEQGCAGQDRYLVVVADDLGRSASVNKAVAMACDAGFLTAASLMAGGDAFEEAVELAAGHPGLSVGLHVMLSDGCPVLSAADVPDLVNDKGLFDESPMRAGIAYWRLRNKIACQIEAEVKAQFDKLEDTGIRPTHVDCHHHLHMHPLLFAVIAREAARRDVAWIRIPLEPWSLVFGLHSPFLDMKAFFMRLVFGLIAIRNLRMARECGLRFTSNVYGLSGTGRMNEEYLLALLPYVKGVVSEIYLHPDLDSSPGREEMKAVTSERVHDRLKAFGLRLVGFRELSALLPYVGSVTDPITQ